MLYSFTGLLHSSGNEQSAAAHEGVLRMYIELVSHTENSAHTGEYHFLHTKVRNSPTQSMII